MKTFPASMITMPVGRLIRSLWCGWYQYPLYAGFKRYMAYKIKVRR
jgi:hypothetical protein